jgi:hypothetical protein
MDVLVRNSQAFWQELKISPELIGELDNATVSAGIRCPGVGLDRRPPLRCSR